MMNCDSSTTLRSLRTPILHGVEMDVCASASNKVHNRIHERASMRPKLKPSNMPPDAGDGKLVEGVTMQRKATDSERVAEYPVP